MKRFRQLPSTAQVPANPPPSPPAEPEITQVLRKSGQELPIVVQRQHPDSISCIQNRSSLSEQSEVESSHGKGSQLVLGPKNAETIPSSGTVASSPPQPATKETMHIAVHGTVSHAH